MGTKIVDGQRFEKWTVLEAYPAAAPKRHHCRARCDCGFERWVLRGALVAGQVKSCRACYERERRPSSVGQVRAGWRIVHSGRGTRVFECLRCGTQITRAHVGSKAPARCERCQEADRCEATLETTRRWLADAREALAEMRPGQGADVRNAVEVIDEALVWVATAKKRIVG